MANPLVWFSALSTAGKVIASTAAVATTGAVIATATPDKPPLPQTTTPVITQEKKTKTKIVTEKKSTDFAEKTVKDGNLPKGETTLRTKGVKGIIAYTYEVTYTDGVETNRELVSKKLIRRSIAQVTAIGTYVKPKPVSNCDPNYSGCVPNVSYDLDCPDIGYSVTVYGSDPHGFDADGDGYGCESY